MLLRFIRSVLHDAILVRLLAGVFIPVLLGLLLIPLALLGVDVSHFDNYLYFGLYIFAGSLVCSAIYIAFFKPTHHKSASTKLLIGLWLGICVIILFLWARASGIDVSEYNFTELLIFLIPIGGVLWGVGIPFLILNMFVTRSSSTNRSIIVHSLVWFMLGIICSGIAVYFLKPASVSYNAYVANSYNKYNSIDNGLTNSCSTVIGSTIFPNINKYYKNTDFNNVDGTLLTGDNTKVAIKLDKGTRTLSIISPTSVEIGQTEPAEYVVTYDTKEGLVAVDPEHPVLNDVSASTFVLNKKTGYAVWTKTSATTFLYQELPEAQVYYMTCI